TRERVVAALTGGPEGDTLIRRAARIAARTKGADLLAVHVARSDGLASGTNPALLARQRTLVESLGGSYHQVVGNHIPTALLLFLAWVVVVALVGGLYPALAAAVAGFLLLNYYFTPPIHFWTISERENVLALIVFLAVAAAVSATVDRAARRTREAAQARAEAETLSTLAGSVVRGSRPLPALLDQLRETFGFTGVSLLERHPDTPPGPDQRRDPTGWRL